MPYTRQTLESLKARFNFSIDFRQIAPGFWLTGEIPRLTDYETANLNQRENINQVVKTENGYSNDNIIDDQAIVLETKKGLVDILGCCHSGIINTLNYIVKKMGRCHIYSVIGGTHLALVNDHTRKKSIDALYGFDIDSIGISHCSGLDAMILLREKFKERFFYGRVGTVLEV